MIRRLLTLVWRRPPGCSCDRRFVGVAHDIDCNIHGLASELLERVA